MNTVKILMISALTGLALGSTGARADARDWYLHQLFQPGQQQLGMERQGRVFIYDGLRDTDVNRAMDEQFERIESMMFTGTVVTDERGEPVRDGATGQVLVENDGC